jgi:hypothetical protein
MEGLPGLPLGRMNICFETRLRLNRFGSDSDFVNSPAILPQVGRKTRILGKRIEREVAARCHMSVNGECLVAERNACLLPSDKW